MASPQRPRRTTAANLDQIAEKATETRQHLVDAIKGLDDIIVLASRNGRQDITDAARAARSAARSAAAEFNENVSGPVTEIDPIALDNAEQAASQALAELHRMHEELKQRVNDLETSRDQVRDALQLDDGGNSVRLSEIENTLSSLDGQINGDNGLNVRVNRLDTDMTSLTAGMTRGQDGKLPSVVTLLNQTVTRVAESAKLNWKRALGWAFVAFLVMFIISWISRGFFAAFTPWWVWAVPAFAGTAVLIWPSTTNTTAPAVVREGRRH